MQISGDIWLPNLSFQDALCQRLLPRLVLLHQPVVLPHRVPLNGFFFGLAQTERLIHSSFSEPRCVLMEVAPGNAEVATQINMIVLWNSGGKLSCKYLVARITALLLL